MRPPRATVCILTYGDWLPYFQRCLDSVLDNTPHGEMELRLGFNDAKKSLRYAIDRLAPRSALPAATHRDGIDVISFRTTRGTMVRLWDSPTNLYKEPMCRRMYYDVPLEMEYVVWFDDDTFVKPGWWPALCAVMDRKIDYIGQRWWFYYFPGQADMVRAQPWYREIPFDLNNGKAGSWFMTGGFMAIRSERIREANYPDVEFTWKGDRLKQFGGDTMLGEIARQLGWTWAKHDKHIQVNVDLEGKHPAPRRGGTGRQFGSDIDAVLQ